MNLRGYTPLFYSQDGSHTLDPPQARLLSMSLTSAAKGGYKEARLSLTGKAADILRYYYMLGKWLPVFAPSGRRIWDGIVWGLRFSNGLSYNLNDIFNAVNVVYSSDIGVRNETGFATDAASIARYGRKELVQSASGLTSATATALRDLLLYFHLHSASAEAFPVPAPAAAGTLSCELVAYGWYATLAFERWVQTSEGAVDTGTQILGVVAASSFVVGDTTTIPTTGVSVSQYRPDQNLTGLAEVERLSALGDSSKNSLWPQVWNDRVFYLNKWGGGDYPAIDYYVGQLAVYDQRGARIPIWCVRADRAIQTPQYMPAGFGVFADPLDTPTALYLLETEMRINQKGVQVTARPAGWRDFVSLVRAP